MLLLHLMLQVHLHHFLHLQIHLHDPNLVDKIWNILDILLHNLIFLASTSSTIYVSSPYSLLVFFLLLQIISTWSLIYGESHHMMGMLRPFTSYQVCYGQGKVWIAYSLPTMVGTSCIPFTPSMSLSFVFHSLDFKLNILSASHIIKTLNCIETFFPTRCIFQDLEMRKTIGRGHKDQGLYLMDGCSL